MCIVVYDATFFFFRFVRFVTFRRVLNAKMKEATQIGVTLKTKGYENEAANNEEGKLFWSKGLFGQSSAE